MILLDTSGLLAALFADQTDHEACVLALTTATPPRVLSPFVLAELDYLILRDAGVNAELAFLAEVARGAYHLAEFTNRDIEAARAVIDRHAALGIGLADASLVVLARRYQSTDLLSLDERHFRVLRSHHDLPFRMLPADAWSRGRAGDHVMTPTSLAVDEA